MLNPIALSITKLIQKYTMDQLQNTVLETKQVQEKVKRNPLIDVK